MYCRHHDAEIDHKDLLEHLFEHQQYLQEDMMGDLTKLTTDLGTLITATEAKDARIAELEATNAQLVADAATKADDDQAGIDALDATVVAALPIPAPVTEPPADGSVPATGDTPLADETQAVLDQQPTA